jgi:hypothetical protein
MLPAEDLLASNLERASSFSGTLGAFSVPSRTAPCSGRTASQIQILIQDVNNLVTAGSLTSGRANALTAKLNAALQQAQKGNPIPRRAPTRRICRPGPGLRQPGLPPAGCHPGADHERLAGGRGAERIAREVSAGPPAAVSREGAAVLFGVQEA